MSTVSIELRIRDTGETDSKGRKLCIVEEEFLGTSYDAMHHGPMLCTVTEAFCRLRRDRFARLMQVVGGIKLLLN